LLQVDVDQFERPEDPDEFYDHQLVGLNVRTVNGELLGTIAEISHLPAQDLLVVTPVAAADESAGPKAEYLIPFVQAIVMSVDLETGLIVDPPLGLLGEIAEPDSSDTDA
jgi:16S rRNA processing protein RimM